MTEQQQQDAPQEIPFDASPNVWLYHGELRAGPGAEEDSPLAAGISWVQILSMEADGAWVRFIGQGDESVAGWKVYVPREKIYSIMLEDKSWPTS